MLAGPLKSNEATDKLMMQAYSKYNELVLLKKNIRQESAPYNIHLYYIFVTKSYVALGTCYVKLDSQSRLPTSV